VRSRDQHNTNCLFAMSMSEPLKDLTAGIVGGCSGIVAGQPFDTVKVRLQAMTQVRWCSEVWSSATRR
jgi:hypothetical protein